MPRVLIICMGVLALAACRTTGPPLTPHEYEMINSWAGHYTDRLGSTASRTPLGSAANPIYVVPVPR